MLVSFPNDVKIYNLSAGKSLPEWLSDRKRRKLLQNDVDLRRKIELIQDFDMPDCSNCVSMSNDGQYIYVAGTYKPRIRCYDVNNLSMKFERCMNSETYKILLLGDGYEKLVLLQEDRWLEFHVQYGRYFRLRIPKFARDFAYHEPSADLYVVGSGADAYRLNLEQGRFVAPFSTSASSLTKVDVNPEHHLMMFGTWEGKIEAWDPRVRNCIGILDSAVSLASENIKCRRVPSISALKFKDGLHTAVGTATGQILLYDIRSNRPYLIKDHNCDLPIKSVDFCADAGYVMSMDNRVIKIWSESDEGKPYTSVEPGSDLNDLHLIRGTGLFFVANESEKVLTYYIPSLGPAPRWCSFLDNITEELEETDQPDVYDDYKFMTVEELGELGLAHLIGSKMLRAYMHGYFIDARLYNKAKALANPFVYQDYRRNKIREQLDTERSNRVKIKKTLPRVNRQLAERLLIDEEAASRDVDEEEGAEKDKKSLASKKKQKKKKAVAESLLHDERFKALFENAEFQVDPDNEEYQMLNPMLVRMEDQKKKKTASKRAENAREENDKSDGGEEDDEDIYGQAGSSSSEDDREYVKKVKENYKEISRRRREREREEMFVEREKRRAKLYEIKNTDEDFRGWGEELAKSASASANEKSVPLANRMKVDDETMVETVEPASSGKEITFSSKKKLKWEEKEQKLADHIRDRRKVRRSAATLKSKTKKFL